MHVSNIHFCGDFYDFRGDFVGDISDFGAFSYSSHRSISIASSPRLSGTGMTSLNL